MIPFEAPAERSAMSRKTVRVLIVDDHAVVREGYRALLEKHEGLTVVGEACDAASAYQCYKDTRPDVVIMDISMPGRGGIDAIEHIREFDASARILVFTMHGGAAYALQAFRAGAKGLRHQEQPSGSSDKRGAERRRRPDGHLSRDQRGARARSGAGGENEAARAFRRASSRFSRMILDAKSTDEIASAPARWTQ